MGPGFESLKVHQIRKAVAIATAFLFHVAYTILNPAKGFALGKTREKLLAVTITLGTRGGSESLKVHHKT